jgi:hypothetical protein
LTPFIVPIVAVITLSAWLGLVYWADAHPGWKGENRKYVGKGDIFMFKISIEVQPRSKQIGCSKALYHVCCWSRVFSVATWFELDENERRIHRYVLLWLIALILILFFVPTSGWLGGVLLGVAFYRLQDLIFSTLDNVFRLTERSKRSDKYDAPNLVLLALVNVIQVVLIFAIAYLILTSHNPRSFSDLPTGRFSNFFLSWISLPPLGGGASPQSTMARILTMIEEGTGLLIIVIAIGRFLSVDQKSGERDEGGN